MMLKMDTYLKWISAIRIICTILTTTTTESLGIRRDIYSPAQREVFPDTATQRKLTLNLGDKVKYVVHYRHLGLIVTKVHRVLTFKQSSLKTYIDFNICQRLLAGSS